MFLKEIVKRPSVIVCQWGEMHVILLPIMCKFEEEVLPGHWYKCGEDVHELLKCHMVTSLL
jgi:hypothetical protein